MCQCPGQGRQAGSGRKTSVISLICAWSSSSMRVGSPSRALGSGTGSGGRSDVPVCFDPGAIHSPGVQASSDINCPDEPPRSALASQLASPTRCPIVFRPLHGPQPFPSLCWVRAEGRGLEPRAVNQIGTRPPGRWGNARRHQPRSQNQQAPPSTPRGANRAVGGIRAWAENPGRRASSYSTLLRLRA
jgi:hypothetical protein